MLSTGEIGLGRKCSRWRLCTWKWWVSAVGGQGEEGGVCGKGDEEGRIRSGG